MDLHPGVTYTFTVEAFNEIGVGNPSDPTVVRTLDERKLINHMYLVSV